MSRREAPLHRTRRVALARCAFVVASLGLFLGCGARTRTLRVAQPDPAPVRGDVQIGECADARTQAVISDHPDLVHADRDLDGDGRDELVVADRALCTGDGNCHWNIYRTEDDCNRYVGTVSASSLQRMGTRGDQGFFGLRALWNLTGGERVLMQEYRFEHDGYRLVDALLCRAADDDRLLCEERGR